MTVVCGLTVVMRIIADSERCGDPPFAGMYRLWAVCRSYPQIISVSVADGRLAHVEWSSFLFTAIAPPTSKARVHTGCQCSCVTHGLSPFASTL